MSDIISGKMDRGEIPLSVFLDLSKAFDTLDHSILLNKLEYYGFHGVALSWFKNYLSDRTQFVDFDGTLSSMLNLNTGVPQGSILGPLLFIIYMNDINVASKKFSAILYADDSNLVSSLCSFDVSLNPKKFCNNQLSNVITEELDKIHEWLQINKLSLNVKKTKFMIFHHRQKDISRFSPVIKINGQVIEKVSDFNFLGLIIDENLSWDAHIQKTSNEISRSIGIMCRLKRFLPLEILRLIYNSLILPHLQYGIMAWGTKSGRLEKLQKRALRIICNSKYNAHTEPLFKKLNLLKLSDIFKTRQARFYYRYINNEVPVYFRNIFSTNSDFHSHDTRSANEIRLTRTKTMHADRGIRILIPKTVSQLPENVTAKFSTHSYNGFSRYLNRHIIDSYQYACNLANCYICQN